MIIIQKRCLVTVDVFYYIPSTHLLNEFIWQTEDTVPDVPRVHRFLNFWKDNIDAIIKDVIVSYGKNGYRTAIYEGRLN